MTTQQTIKSLSAYGKVNLAKSNGKISATLKVESRDKKIGFSITGGKHFLASDALKYLNESVSRELKVIQMILELDDAKET